MDPTTLAQAVDSTQALGPVELPWKDLITIIGGSSLLTTLLNVLFWFVQKRFEFDRDYDKQILQHRLEAFLRLKKLMSAFKHTLKHPGRIEYHIYLMMEHRSQYEYIAALSQFLDEKGIWLGGELEQQVLEFKNYLETLHTHEPYKRSVLKAREDYAIRYKLRHQQRLDKIDRAINKEMPRLKRIGAFLESFNPREKPVAKLQSHNEKGQQKHEGEDSTETDSKESNEDLN